MSRAAKKSSIVAAAKAKRTRARATRRESSGAQTHLQRSQPETRTHNVVGLLSLPVELFSVILSHIPGVPVLCERITSANGELLHRNRTILALSLTSRWVRAAVIALVWETIEVCAMYEEGKAVYAPWMRQDCPEKYFHIWQKEFARNLVEKLEIVTIREPVYASCVKTITVCLTGYSAPTVYPEFIRALQCFPHLENLQIQRVSTASSDLKAFNKCVSQVTQQKNWEPIHCVKTMLLPAPIQQLLIMFRGLRRLFFVQKFDDAARGALDKAIEIHGETLQEIDCDQSPLLTSRWSYDIVTKLPNLRVFPFIMDLVERRAVWKKSRMYSFMLPYIQKCEMVTIITFYGHESDVKDSDSVKLATEYLREKKSKAKDRLRGGDYEIVIEVSFPERKKLVIKV